MPNLYHNSVLFAAQVMQAFDVVRAITSSKNIVSSYREKNKQPDRSISPISLSRYQSIIHSLTGQTYDHHEAKSIWLNILSHQADMICELKRDPGIVVAALDFIENISPIKDSHFVFIEKKELQQLIEMSLLDGLTQLYNRNSFMLMVEKELQLCKRHDKTAALLLIDLDNFKSINDGNGHQKGDLALISSSKIIKESIRAMDIAGRYGGDEFIVFLPDANEQTTSFIAQRIKDRINKESPLDCKVNQENEVSVSIGVSYFPNNGIDVNDLIYSADMALYKAKEEGKNMVVCSS
jgi:diguanylate cyclase (GGDEF)-like protein